MLSYLAIPRNIFLHNGICYSKISSRRRTGLEKVKTSITLDKDVYKQIQKIAEADDRKFSQMVNKILKDFIRAAASDPPEE